MPKPGLFARLPRFFVAAVTLALLVGACADEGTTPKCVTENGGQCDQFPVCKKNPKNPAECCTDAEDVTSCLAGYGVGINAGTGGGTGGN